MIVLRCKNVKLKILASDHFFYLKLNRFNVNFFSREIIITVTRQNLNQIIPSFPIINNKVQ